MSWLCERHGIFTRHQKICIGKYSPLRSKPFLCILLTGTTENYMEIMQMQSRNIDDVLGVSVCYRHPGFWDLFGLIATFLCSFYNRTSVLFAIVVALCLLSIVESFFFFVCVRIDWQLAIINGISANLHCQFVSLSEGFANLIVPCSWLLWIVNTCYIQSVKWWLITGLDGWIKQYLHSPWKWYQFRITL